MKSVLGFDENIVAAFCYVLGFFSGILVLIMEKENKFVRFHALQSTLWFLLLAVLTWGLGFIGSIPILGLVLSIVISPALWLLRAVTVISWLFLVIKAFGGSSIKIPIIGEVVWAQINK